MHPAQTLDAFFEPLGRTDGHRLNVAAGAEAASGAGDDDRTYLGILTQALQRLPQGGQHRRRKRVQAVRAVEGQPGDSVVRRLQKIRHFALLATDRNQSWKFISDSRGSGNSGSSWSERSPESGFCRATGAAARPLPHTRVAF